VRVISFAELKSTKGIPFSAVWIRDLVAKGKFPKPIRLGGNRVGFLEEEVDRWLRDRAAERDVEQSTAEERKTGAPP
jgi:prophage regulatory protein